MLRGRRDASVEQELHDVYRAHVRAVYAFFAYTLPGDAAEELTATTFERVVRAWDSYDARQASVRTWVLAIARNLLADHYRRQSHRDSVSLDAQPALSETLVATDDPLTEYLSTDTVRSWLSALEPREREVLALRFGADLPARDIARCLGLTEANVHQISSRALRRLQQRLSTKPVSDSA
jgi:RNA polymerase sigma factor (sigma-70 family)